MSVIQGAVLRAMVTSVPAAVVVWLFAFAITYVSSQSASYVGCYADDSTDRLLQGHMETFNEGLTHEKCNQLCLDKGFMFAATQNGIECHCGDYNRGKLDPVDEAQCNLSCNGNPSQKCGGYLRLSAYRTGITDILPVGKMLGCFDVNGQPNRILNDHYLELRKTNSPMRCLNICRLLGFKLAGVRNAHGCHCGNELHIANENRKALNDDECQVLTCPGDGSEFCGSELKLMLYRTGPPDDIPNVVNIGCYSDRPGGLLNGHKENMGVFASHTRCVSKCFQLGFDYAGIKNGNECNCGDYPVGSPPVKVVTSRCNVPCAGKRDEMCGGDEELTGYNVGLQKNPINESIGCFRNEMDRYLNYGYKVDLMSTNSPLKCVNICRHLNFPYAGLENRFRCYCSNTTPSMDTVVPANECDKRCSGDLSQTCGGRLAVKVYETGLSPASQPGWERRILNDGHVCEKSVTTVSNVVACKGREIFKETFPVTKLNLGNWRHVVKISGNEEYEFVVYDKNQSNVYIDKSKLILAPSVMPDEFVTRGKLEMNGCTGVAGTADCQREAVSYSINPPILSAQVDTKHTFSFRYGIVNIRAKLPTGDWIVPQLLLKPKEETYGPNYRSGVIRIALVNGNADLVCDGKNEGINYLKSGVLVGTGERIRGRNITRVNSKHPWTAKWHNYTVVWKPGGISFLIDGKEEEELLPIGTNKISEAVGFAPEESTIWSQGTVLAPFDKEFYIALGVSVGGMREFSNNCVSSGRKKPWNNFEVKAMLKFWQDKANWEATWNEDSKLQIENIVVTALDQ